MDKLPINTPIAAILRALQATPQVAIPPVPPTAVPEVQTPALDPFLTKLSGKDQDRLPAGFQYPALALK